MNFLLIVCTACSAVAALGFTVLFFAETSSIRRRSGYRSLLRQRYLHIVMLALCADRPAVPRFPLLRRPGSGSSTHLTLPTNSLV